MRAFFYVILYVVDYVSVIICTNTIILMVWMEYPNFFCYFLGTLTNVSNALVETYLQILWYRFISDIPNTGPDPPHTPDSLTHMYCYMGDVIMVVQVSPEIQSQVFDIMIPEIKWIFPSFPKKSKNLVSIKKL